MEILYCPICKENKVKTKLKTVIITEGKGLDSYYCPKCDIEFYSSKAIKLLLTKNELYKLKEGGY